MRKKKVKEDDVNMFIIKCAQPQLRGKRKGEERGRGRGGEGESRRSTVSFNASRTQ